MKILIATAVAAERNAVLKGLDRIQRQTPWREDQFQVVVAGVGPVAAGVSTAKALAKEHYSLVISAGIGGGFPDQTELGELVIADQIVAPDLGVAGPTGFCPLEELGFGSTRIKVDSQLVDKAMSALAPTSLSIKVGPVLTVTTATGTAAGAAELLKREPRAVAEAMEGFGVAWAAQEFGVPFLELRAISNYVGPRDRPSWKIQEALAVLEIVGSQLGEV